VETKRALYQQQPSCRYVLTVQQDRFEIRVDSRPNETWSEQHLSVPDNELIISEFGLRCTISELYRGTALLPLRSGKQ
jgi:Uma2 family endonuclease